MAWFAGFASSIGGKAIIGGINLGKTVGSPFAGEVMSPAKRGAQYVVNRLVPNQAPSPDQMINAYLAGHLTFEDLYPAIKEQHGIALLATNADAKQSVYWQAVLESMKGVPGIELSKEMWLRGAMDDDSFLKSVRRNGIWDIGAALYLKNRSEQVTPDAVCSWYRQGKLTIDEARAWLEWLGFTESTANDLMLQQQTPLDMVALFQLLNRGDIDRDRFERELVQVGYGDVKTRELLHGLKDLIPGPSDLARYAVRESWTQDVVDTFKYDSEFPEIFQYWMDKQGLGWQTPEVTIGGVTYPSVSWPMAHWRAHWELPSPTQSYSFLQRARGDIGNPASWRIPGLEPFDSKKLALLLKTKDYPPYFRPYLEAMSYRVMDTRGIRWARKYDGMLESEGIERYQDQGYRRDTAEILSRTDTARLLEGSGKSGRDFSGQTAKMAVRCLLDAYSLGTLTTADAQADLEALDLPATAVAQRLAVVDQCWSTAQAKLAIAAVRKAYLGGELDWMSADRRLMLAGVTPAARTRYQARWQVQFTPDRKALSTQQVIDALTRGYITRLEAEVRLTNIGWDSPDMVILFAGAARIIAERQAAADAKLAKTQKAEAKAIQDAIKQAQQQQRDLVRELNRVQPLAMMIRLAKKGDITQADVMDALTARGVPPSAQNYYLEDIYGTIPTPPKPPPVPTGTAGSA